MRKTLLLCICILAMGLCLTGCDKQRKTVAIDKFKQVCDIELLEEVDSSEWTSEYEGITDIYGARLVGGDLEAVYMTFSGEDTAKAAYESMFEAMDLVPAGSKVSMDGDNYRSVTHNDGHIYTRVIRVDNMLIKVKGAPQYKTEIDKIISNFGNYPVSAV